MDRFPRQRCNAHRQNGQFASELFFHQRLQILFVILIHKQRDALQKKFQKFRSMGKRHILFEQFSCFLCTVDNLYL